MAEKLPAALRRFLESEDLEAIEKPLDFEKHSSYTNYLCCSGLFNSLSTVCIAAATQPVSSCCPSLLASSSSLQLGSDAVKASWAQNDCCFSKEVTEKTIPLDNIHDVELTESRLQAWFGLKQVNIHTAGSSSGPDVAAAFLAHPEHARDAIKLAVKLHRTHTEARTAVHASVHSVPDPPVQHESMQRHSNGVADAPSAAAAYAEDATDPPDTEDTTDVNFETPVEPAQPSTPTAAPPAPAMVIMSTTVAPAPFPDPSSGGGASNSGGANGNGTVASSGHSLMQRLQALDQLVRQEVLTQQEMRDLRVAVLAQQDDLSLLRLSEAAELLAKNTISQEEFQDLKSRLLAQIMRP